MRRMKSSGSIDRAPVRDRPPNAWVGPTEKAPHRRIPSSYVFKSPRKTSCLDDFAGPGLSKGKKDEIANLSTTAH
jgi:hypothetical protein